MSLLDTECPRGKLSVAASVDREIPQERRGPECAGISEHRDEIHRGWDNVKVIKGGAEAWQRAGYPMTAAGQRSR
jgi:hypothetical protein